ncbi:MAG: hypothetical protein ACR2MN_14380 [Acidimicrobiales bacterium]
MTSSNARRVHVGDLEVPFREVDLHDSPDGTANPPLRLYDTGGPGSDPQAGLDPRRAPWIEERGDTETY